MMKFARLLFWIVVCASLLANAVVLGIAWRASELREIVGGGAGGFSDLPQPIRAEFLAVLQENRQDLLQPLADLGAARRDMFAAAAARPYDQAAVEAAMVRVRAATTALQIETHRLMQQAFDQAAP
jgi:uncharacterized membrane protein